MKASKAILLSLLLSFLASQNSFAQPEKSNIKDSKLIKKDIPDTSSETVIKKQPDSDGDGIIDSLDKCPDEKGVIQYDGCPMPDTDNDGIADDLDECPTEPGLIKNKGCPSGDRDGDKISDDEDKCPDIPGMARFEGCPTRDTDGDGVNDDDDKCVDIAGPSDNFGCPQTKEYRKILKKQDSKKKSAIPSGKNKN